MNGLSKFIAGIKSANPQIEQIEHGDNQRLVTLMTPGFERRWSEADRLQRMTIPPWRGKPYDAQNIVDRLDVLGARDYKIMVDGGYEAAALHIKVDGVFE
jgi:hypothetical protein